MHRPGEEEDLPWKRWWFWDSTSSFVPLVLETWSREKALELLAKGQHSLRDVRAGDKLLSGVFLAWLAVGCGDCQLCFLEGQGTLSSQAWPVLDKTVFFC